MKCVCIVLSTLLFVVVYVRSERPADSQSVTLNIDESLGFELLKYKDGDTLIKLKGHFKIPSGARVIRTTTTPGQTTFEWSSEGRLTVRNVTEDCVSIELTGEDAVQCFDYGTDSWYGGSERHEQVWPIESARYKHEPFVTQEADYKAVLEPYWINSKGASIYVSADTPLFTDSHNMQNNSLCLYANDTPPYNPRPSFSLKIETCAYSDAREAHINGVARYLGKPTGIPDVRMFRYPIWSTWARYKRDIDEEKVLQYATEILDHKFPNCQLEIDDKWEPCYGAFEFDLEKFPNMSLLSEQLKDMGYRVTLWVTPFINTNCEPSYTTALNEGRFVKNEEGSVRMTWWNGIGAHVDFTNETTKEWWTKRLRTVMDENGIDSIKFDAGETSWLPQLPQINVDENLYPDEYPRHYVDTALEFGSFIEVRVGRRTQSRPVFVRMIDKNSRWGINNGLQSLITTLFQMNIAGYPFVLPDMIGGNKYFPDILTKELFIRWLQANALMPSLQFSYVPWDFDDETVVIAQKFVELHANYTDEILAVASGSVASGYPINAPIWWIDPLDETSLKCRDEYLLGEDLLVAPVLVNGARARDIYLPNGHWKDLTRGSDEILQGRQWLRNYTAELDELPLFRRVNDGQLTIK